VAKVELLILVANSAWRSKLLISWPPRCHVFWAHSPHPEFATSITVDPNTGERRCISW